MKEVTRKNLCLKEIKMEEQTSRKIKKRITMISILMLVVVVGYIIYAIVSKNLSILVFQILIGAFLIIYLLLLDIIEPLLLKQFDNITAEQKKAYFKFIGIDILGTGCLSYFILSMGKDSSEGFGSFYAALIYMVTIRIKYKFKHEFMGIKLDNKIETVLDIQEDAVEKEEIPIEKEEIPVEKDNFPIEEEIKEETNKEHLK